MGKKVGKHRTFYSFSPFPSHFSFFSMLGTY
jgi:hypothetical protein